MSERKMPVRSLVSSILKHGGKVTLQELEFDFANDEVLGSGVEAWDIVSMACNAGKVCVDQVKRTAWLSEKMIEELVAPERKNLFSATAYSLEERPPDGLRISDDKNYSIFIPIRCIREFEPDKKTFSMFLKKCAKRHAGNSLFFYCEDGFAFHVHPEFFKSFEIKMV